MRAQHALLAVSLTAAILSGSAFAQDTKKEELTTDPNVRGSQAPQITPLGKNEPQNHDTSGSADNGTAAKPNLQTLIDQAHNGSTGTTTPRGTRQRPDQPAELKDGTAPRVIEKPL